MHIQDSQRQAGTGADGVGGASRVPAPLRVDAQRNLEHVLRAAREVFGELGYGAPMEDVARRARVGVGTVYRRFPSKDVLVRRIAEEETARLTEQARTALGQENEAWSALARFLRTSAASGAGRLLPPQVLRVQGPAGGPGGPQIGADQDHGHDHGHEHDHGHAVPGAGEPVRVPQQRTRFALPGAGPAISTSTSTSGSTSGSGSASTEYGSGEYGVGDRTGAGVGSGIGADSRDEQDGIAALLDVVGQLVERARAAGELRRDVSVADVLLVIATAAPALPDAAQQAAASARLLDILLDGLRSRPGEHRGEHRGSGRGTGPAQSS